MMLEHRSEIRLNCLDRTDFRGFMKSHRAAIQKGKESGDYVPGVMNYYSLMSDSF